ncbi:MULTISPECIES: FAD-dependent oxidoreductase [unclassified Pseudomonas]|uniref:FAD-dependent oxidoreductase n=1 Tax=unclassified Pseudomonas TaxID=196821 RepID=UPI000D3D417E|nr:MULTISPECIES: FAD-dependent oxidoreductase [unclassified Pseudomonas]RAU45086.1 pyridine nucleotide-disulfide oxidoreductase [Pseudomonas sp. RIT 409]RAU51464.1 pyridine nucleotide-disulfide oxidoreductase [Pseudomonas sp. RIT 412]
MPMHRVARLADLPADRGMEVEAGEKKVVLVRHGQDVRAYQAHCPHAGAPLADGAVCNGHLICPWHKAEFAVSDGHLCEPPALDALTRYRTEVIDGQIHVDDQAFDVTPRTLPEDERCFVIIGAGAAGTAAACALREMGFNGRLQLIDRESAPGYDRTALSKFVIAADMRPDETPSLREEAFYSAHRIERVEGEVMKLDAINKRLTLTDGRRIDYDSALITTGAEPRALPLIGADLPQVLTLRCRDDADKILAAAQPGSHALIVGDSFIGLEAASALRKHGVDVTVLARHEVPFVKLWGERIGKALRALHEQHGVLFRTHVEVSRFEGQAPDRLDLAVLSNGERLPIDLALIGIGVTPATQFVDGIQREQDGSLSVDASMQVGKDLWAAGDVATFPLAGQPKRIEHWRLAQQQARIAASNMLGVKQHYHDVPYFWTYHFEKRLDYLGHADAWDDIVYLGDPEAFDFLALICKQGSVSAVVGCEREREMAMLAERLKRPLFKEEALMLIHTMSQ